MRVTRNQTSSVLMLIAILAYAVAARAQEISFIAATAAHGYAVSAYETIWNEHGSQIVAALEARTCLRFPESAVSAIVADSTSNSGGPEHPMTLRASYAPAVKQSTLAHELGHRHLWQLSERLDEIDGHRTLFLILDLVWTDVWGKDFADAQVRHESEWQAGYDYAEAWTWARSLGPEERARLWNELLALNGHTAGCDSLIESAR